MDEIKKNKEEMKCDCVLVFFLFFVFVFLFVVWLLGPHPWHMEAPRLVVVLELQLPAYITDTAKQDSSHVCDLHHSSQQHQILKTLSKARDGTCILMNPSRVCYC